MQRLDKNRAPLILLFGDLIGLLLFVYVGQRDHATIDAANPLLGMLPDVIAFALPWSVAAWLLGALRLDDPADGLHRFFARSLNAWLVAALFGLLLRSFILGRAALPVSFIVATLIFGGLFLFAWRVVFVLARTFGTRIHMEVRAYLMRI